MTQLLNIQGAPGTGKTRLLLQNYISACEILGPDRVLAVTYTRAAADELRERCAAALGIVDTPWNIRRRLPWCGTIHSMCLKLSDISPGKLIAGSNSKLLQDFDPRLKDFKLPEVGDDWTMDEPTRKSEDVEAALWVRHAAVNRMIPLEDAWDLLDPELARNLRFETIELMVENYEKWKEARGYADFEDLLLHGRDLQPPVRVVLADECQDNSPLLWSVINAWGRASGTASFVCAGDAYQALYSFSGGDPRLFSDRDGAWHVIRESHRFDEPSAQYARRILEPAFGRDQRFEQLSAFEGVGPNPGTDPSQFWLARTNTLVKAKALQLQRDAEPYGYIRGRGPLQTKGADAYRALLKAQRGDLISKDDLATIAGAFDTAAAKKAARYIRTLPTGYYGATTVEAAFGCSTRAIAAMLPYYAYYLRLAGRHGPDVIFKRPLLSLGTVHCSPPDEPILTVNRGYVAIADLQMEDRLASYATDSGYLKNLRLGHTTKNGRAGYPFSRVERLYSGTLLTIKTEHSVTRVTPNHVVRARFSPDAAGKYIVYLMRKGSWWRVGQTCVLRTRDRSSGLTRRIGNERADEAWILEVCENEHDALYLEAGYAIYYGVPTAGFINLGKTTGRGRRLSDAEYGRIFDVAGPQMRERAERLLADTNLSPNYPFYVRNNGQLRSDKRSFDLAAINLSPRLMVLGAITEGGVVWGNFSVTRESYSGTVYDLEVLPHHYYFSGGLLVHNSAKGKEAGSVTLCTSWATKPYAALKSTEGRRGETCTAYVAATRHKHNLKFETLRGDSGGLFPFPRKS